jgi:NhaP-type Na+/H+ or K+/H+ antiporter
MSGSRTAARAALVLGFLALAAIPVAVAVSWQRSELRLLQALLIAVPVGFVLGLIAVALSRRARLRFERSVRRNGRKLVRAARLVAWSGVYVSVTGGLALAFYGILRASS